MADNTTLDPGAGGDTIATDDVAGVKYQRVKLVNGTADATDAIPGDASNGLDVDVTRVQGNVTVVDGGGSLTVDGSVTADTELTTADLDTGAGTDTRAVVGLVIAKSGGAANISNTDPLPISDAGGNISIDDGGNSITVDGTVSITANSSVNMAQVAGTTTDTNSGVKSAGTQRVVLATDQPQLTNALKVDGSAVTQPVSDGAGSLTVDASAATFGVNNAQVSGTAISVNSGAKDAGTQRVILASDQTVVPVSDNSGSLTVDAPLATPVFVTPTPGTTGGWSKVKYAAQTTTKQAVKASAGTFGGFYYYNPNASVAYVQVFDVASAGVTLGTTAPDMIFGVPASSGAVVEIGNGVNMATAITLACTTTATGSTAPGTGLDLTVFFK